MTLTAAMIVKDEEKNIRRCLGSILDLCDKIVVVDTGSTDKTMDICKAHYCEVYQQEWQEDFSFHRNYSLQLASKNSGWILVIDADEEFCAVNWQDFKKRLKELPPHIHALVVTMQDVNQDGTKGNTYQSARFFRSDVGVHYNGAVHNQPVIPYGVAAATDIVIYHYGYDLDPEAMAKKKNRLAKMLNAWMFKEPENPEPYFYMANTCFSERAWIKTIFYAEKCLQLTNDDGIKPADLGAMGGLYSILAACYLEIGAYARCQTCLQHGFALYPNDVDLHFIKTKLSFELDFKQEVILSAQLYSQALEIHQKQPYLMAGRFTLCAGEDSQDHVKNWLQIAQE